MTMRVVMPMSPKSNLFSTLEEKADDTKYHPPSAVIGKYCNLW